MKKLHLLVSAFIVIIVALIYGGNPAKILPLIFDFEVENLELKNIFRAIMGLYLGFSFFWLFGVVKEGYRETATLTNVIFMGGLAVGRLASFVFDGVSYQYISGLILELIFMFWGIYNLQSKKK